MAAIVKTPAGTWKAVVRKTGWPTNTKTFRTKRDAEGPLEQLSTAEREKIIALLRDVSNEDARNLLAELSKAMTRPGHITQSPIQYFHGILQRHRSGDFVPTTPGAKAAAELARAELKALVSKPNA